jgi:hypothetical protein
MSIFIFIILGLVVAWFGLLYIGMPILMFVFALAEKIKLLPLTPINLDRSRLSEKAQTATTQAVREGFYPIGLFSDEGISLKAGIHFFMLSSDRRTLLWMHEGLGRRYNLISSFDGDRWLITSDILGGQDLSGLELEEMLPEVEFAVVFDYHLERVTNVGEKPLSVDADNVARMILEHERNRVESMAKRGLVRYLDAEKQTWLYTPKGAAKISLTAVKNNFNVLKRRDFAQQRAEKMKQVKIHF